MQSVKLRVPSAGLPESLNHRVPFFCHAFARVGTALRDYSEMARRIDEGLRRGAVGVGFGTAYTPAASPWEVLEMFRVAGRHRAPAYIHVRRGVEGVQEALANIAKHSSARNARLVIARKDGRIEFLVEDDGAGKVKALPVRRFGSFLGGKEIEAIAGGNVVPITSFTYKDVGINIDLEPRVHHNKEITLKLQIEVSQVTGQIDAGGGPSKGVEPECWPDVEAVAGGRPRRKP